MPKTTNRRNPILPNTLHRTHTRPATTLDLAEYDEAFASAPSERTWSSPPEGRYTVLVEAVTIEESTNVPGHSHRLNWKLRILGPTAINQYLYKRNYIGKESIAFLKQDLYLCGVRLNSVSNLPAELHRLKGLRLEVNLRLKDGYQRVYFHRLLEPPKVRSAPAYDEDIEDDDNPDDECDQEDEG